MIPENEKTTVRSKPTRIAVTILIAIGFVAGLALVFVIMEDWNRNEEIRAEQYERVSILKSREPTLSPLVTGAMADDRITSEEYTRILVEYQQATRRRLKTPD